MTEKVEKDMNTTEKKRIINNRISKEKLDNFKTFLKTDTVKNTLKNTPKKNQVSTLKKTFQEETGAIISKSTIYKLINPKKDKSE